MKKKACLINEIVMILRYYVICFLSYNLGGKIIRGESIINLITLICTDVIRNFSKI